MRHWKVPYYGHEFVVMSDDEILALYWDEWLGMMVRYNLAMGYEEYKGVNPIACIMHWTSNKNAIAL